MLVVLAGTALRAALHFERLPFRVDELRLIANLVERSFAGLAAPLDHGQTAPVGFLWLEKAVLELTGTPDELALRALPLVASIAALVLTLAVGRRLALGSGGLVATLFLALSPALVMRASDVKQYATDSLATLVVLLVALPLVDGGWSRAPTAVRRRRLVLLACTGALALLLSHPAAFTVAATGLVLAALAVQRRDWRGCLGLLPVAVLWILVIAGIFAIPARHAHARESLMLWFEGDFMPLPPRSLADLAWFASIPARLCRAMHLPQVALALLLGAVGVRRFLPRRGARLALLVAPIALALLASGLELYPFEGRLLTFAVPLVGLLVGAGWQTLVEALGRHRLLVGVLLLLLTLRGMVGHLFELPRWEGGRYDVASVLETTAPEIRGDDVLLVAGPLRYPFAHYAPAAGISRSPTIVELPITTGEPIRNLEIESLAGRRAWLFVPHRQLARRGRRGPLADPRLATCARLDAHGRRLTTRSSINVSGILYAFDAAERQ